MQHLLVHKFKIIALLWTVFITVLSLVSLQNAPVVPLEIEGKDKVVHFLFYFFFVLLWTIGFSKNKIQPNLVIVFIAVIYGIIIEVLQYNFTATRHADFYDALANSLGAVVAYFILRLKNKS